MEHRLSNMQHIRAITVLGVPLIGSHIAQYAINLTDAVMLGWYDVETLAAQVLGGMMFFVMFIFGSGFALAVMPMVASAEASDDQRQVRRVTRMAIWISLLFCLLVMPLFIWSRGLFLLMGQEEHIAELAGQYLRIAGWGIIPALVVMVLKSYLAALSRAGVVLWVTVGAAVANALVNYLLIFGKFGLPELGIRGAAIASLSVQAISLLLLVLYVVRKTPEHELFVRFWRPDWEAFGQVFRLGWPIGVTLLSETGLFAASSVMMGWLGTLPLAAHGVALQVITLVFMLHLGLSNAATVRAGQAYGRNDVQGLQRGGIVVITMSMLIAALAVMVFLVFPQPLIGLFISPDDPSRDTVVAIGVSLLAAGALFQVVDAAQVMALGLLRGVQDTRVPMVIAALSYWAVGAPVSYMMGFVLGWGGVGIWLGLAVGLALAGIFMMIRFWSWSMKQVVVAPIHAQSGE